MTKVHGAHKEVHGAHKVAMKKGCQPERDKSIYGTRRVNPEHNSNFEFVFGEYTVGGSRPGNKGRQ